MLVLSDVHGDIEFCRQIALAQPNQTIVQLGDLGVGFVDSALIESLPSNFHFFPGNHDNRKEAIKLKNCLGHYGEFKNIFFVSGADSFDKNTRREGETWWRDEELDYRQAVDCLDKWESSKSEILVSHDAPQSFVEGYYLVYARTMTRNLLEQMIQTRKPKLVISGHHHKALRVDVWGINWISLGIGEDVEC